MPLPDPLRVKLSTEAAGYVALTPVVVQDMSLLEVVERIVSVTGKDVLRVCEVLRRGSLVSGSSRLRWQPLDVDSSDLAGPFRLLPDDDPSRPFEPGRCARFVLSGSSSRVELSRASADERRLLRAKSFWAEVLAVAQSCPAEYCGYNYRGRADRYRIQLKQQDRQRLREAAALLRFPQTSSQIRTISIDFLDLYIPRQA